MLLLIDNYDSFTYNLVQYLQACEDRGEEPHCPVCRRGPVQVEQLVEALLDDLVVVAAVGVVGEFELLFAWFSEVSLPSLPLHELFSLLVSKSMESSMVPSLEELLS